MAESFLSIIAALNETKISTPLQIMADNEVHSQNGFCYPGKVKQAFRCIAVLFIFIYFFHKKAKPL